MFFSNFFNIFWGIAQSIFRYLAELILDHYDTVQGTFGTLSVSPSSGKGGWQGNEDAIGAAANGNVYRYENAPQMTQVRPGISTVTVNLIAVI